MYYTKPAKNKRRSNLSAIYGDEPRPVFDPMGVGSCAPRVHWYVIVA